MKDNNIKHNWDDLLEQDLFDKRYRVPADFVDRVMDQINEPVRLKPVGKILKFAFRFTAALAILFFASNVVMVFSSIEESKEQQVYEEWNTMYAQEQVNDWYDYYYEDILGSNENFAN